MTLGPVFRRPFPEQVAAFRLRLGNLVPTATWQDIWKAEHDRAFMVAGATKADLLADLAAAVDRAISEGTSLEQFRRDFRKIVAERGWTGWTGSETARGRAWRTRVIYRTNARVSYAAGRHAQLQSFPLWIYRHGGSAEPRLHHLALDRIVLPREHRFWTTHYPPNGWGCSCYVTGAYSANGARLRGGDPDKPLPEGWDRIDGKTGAPVGIDRGWDYAPGASVSGEIATTVSALAGKLPKLPAEIGAAMFDGLSDRARAVIEAQFGEFLETALTRHVQQSYMVIGALKLDWLLAARQRGLAVESAEIAITDKNIQHFFRGTPHLKAESTRDTSRQPKVDPLDIDWFRDLPRHLRSPRAVFLDRTHRDPSILLVYDLTSSSVKLVVRINIPVKKAGGIMNLVTTGRIVAPRDILADIGRGVELIYGGI